MYRERQFLGLFTVHYHYRTENRDSTKLAIGYQNKQPKSQHYCLICLMKKTWKQRMYNMHAAVQQARLPQTAHLHDVNCSFINEIH